MRARAPASAANLGPGFDVVAVALDRYVEVEVEPADSLSVRTEGEGAGFSDTAEHLAARVAARVLGHNRFSLTVRSQIPVARGLGSSAALAAAAAAAAGASDPLAVAASADGHPDNAAAAVLGGLVVVAMVDGEVRARRMRLDPGLAFVAVVPDRALSTDEARRVLPGVVQRTDAAFNLGRLGLLLAGLEDHRHLVPAATEDRLHEPYRRALFPESTALCAALRDAGALATCWSGAGPTVLGITAATDAVAVADAGRAALAAASLSGRVMVLEPDQEGLVVGERAVLPPLPAPEAWPGSADLLGRPGAGAATAASDAGR